MKNIESAIYRGKEFRSINAEFEQVFPNLDRDDVREHFSSVAESQNDDLVKKVVTELANGGYEWLVETQGIYNPELQTFTGDHRLCAPAFALLLTLFGMPARYHVCEQVTAKVSTKEKFSLTYQETQASCVEFKIGQEQFYVAPDAIKVDGEKLVPTLAASCYLASKKPFVHARVPTKSGFYLQPWAPRPLPDNFDFKDRVIILKQTDAEIAKCFTQFEKEKRAATMALKFEKDAKKIQLLTQDARRPWVEPLPNLYASYLRITFS
jgi:hypothetical protein